MREKIRNWIKNYFELYDIEDLQTGAHCGCCGRRMPDTIVPKVWAWDICNKCIHEG